MSALANAIDFLCDGTFFKIGKDKKDKRGRLLPMLEEHKEGMKTMLILAYSIVFILSVWVYDAANIGWKRGWKGFSFSYYVGTAVQFLGFTCLYLKVHGKRSVEGISSQTLVLFAVSLSFRIFTTLIYDGYLPVDWSGDWVCQLMDFATLIVIFGLLHAMHRKFVNTYQEEHDDLNIGGILLASVAFSFIIQGGLNQDFYYDALWAFSLNVEVFQMLPQLYMLTKVGGVVDHTTAHWVVNVFLGCVCRFAFWIWAIPGCKELSPVSGDWWNMNIGAYYILVAYSLQSLIYADFLYYYVRARWMGFKGGHMAVVVPAFDPSRPMEV